MLIILSDLLLHKRYLWSALSLDHTAIYHFIHFEDT